MTPANVSSARPQHGPMVKATPGLPQAGRVLGAAERGGAKYSTVEAETQPETESSLGHRPTATSVSSSQMGMALARLSGSSCLTGRECWMDVM